jgi:intracellular sulfur oxidation DsrE/DsrF family protein
MSTIVIVNTDGMGQGDAALGQRLLGNFLGKARRLPDLEALCFYNAGVKLLCADSPVLQHLAALSDAGVELVACGTCVDHFQLTGELRVGTVTGMDDIVGRMARATKVITL